MWRDATKPAVAASQGRPLPLPMDRAAIARTNDSLRDPDFVGSTSPGKGNMLKTIFRMGALAAALGGAASPAFAQADAPPDPSSITLPDMTPTRDRRVIADGWKHFYFHKAGVTYAEAYADFAECYRFLPRGALLAGLPMFAPWRETPGGVEFRPTNNYGLVGMAIAALVQGPLERRHRQSRMRRCMEPRGYVRYPLAEDAWRRLIDGYSRGSIALQALAASGPTPDLEPVTR
jgi:hypothetical protein